MRTLGQVLIAQGEYSRAEPYCREAMAFLKKNSPDRQDRFLAELRLGVCLLAQKKYSEARSRLLSAYNGLKPREQSPLPTTMSDLGWIIEQLIQLRDESGQLINDVSLAKLRGDPALQSILFDLKFPADPFAPDADARATPTALRARGESLGRQAVIGPPETSVVAADERYAVIHTRIPQLAFKAGSARRPCVAAQE